MNPTLKLIFEILVVIELVTAGVSFTVWTMRKKSNVPAIIISDVLLTIGFVFLIIFVFSKSPDYGYGGGKYLFTGVVYMVPPLVFSKMKIKENIIIVMMGFLYAFLVYALSLRITYFFNLTYLALVMFVVQTIIHAIILVVFLAIKKKYKNTIFPPLNEKIKTRALILSVLSFLLIISFNTNLTRATSSFQKLWSVALLVAFVAFSLVLIFDLWSESAQTEKLTNEVKEDRLTGLKNRLAFKEDINELIVQERQFSLIYIDLDKFKTINDTYGHLVGDQYLIAFSKTISFHETESQRVYRLSGDEFCFVTEDKEQTVEFLINIQDTEKLLEDINFLGFSYGIADYPEDGQDANLLLQHSDMKMYHMKKEK